MRYNRVTTFVDINHMEKMLEYFVLNLLGTMMGIILLASIKERVLQILSISYFVVIQLAQCLHIFKNQKTLPIILSRNFQSLVSEKERKVSNLDLFLIQIIVILR